MVIERADAVVAAYAGPSGEYMADAPAVGVQVAGRSVEPVITAMAGCDGGGGDRWWKEDESRK